MGFVITADLLESKEACLEQLEIFRLEWPAGCEVTLQNCRRVVELQFDLNWIVTTFLSAPALKTYEEAKATAWRAYEEARAPALRAYEEAADSTRKTYVEATATAIYQAPLRDRLSE